MWMRNARKQDLTPARFDPCSFCYPGSFCETQDTLFPTAQAQGRGRLPASSPCLARLSFAVYRLTSIIYRLTSSLLRLTPDVSCLTPFFVSSVCSVPAGSQAAAGSIQRRPTSDERRPRVSSRVREPSSVSRRPLIAIDLQALRVPHLPAPLRQRRSAARREAVPAPLGVAFAYAGAQS